MSNEVRPPIDIGGASKSRPGPLDPDENRPRPVPQGSIQRGGGSGGGTSWMPAIIAIVVSVIASAVMVFMFNPAKAGVETLSNQVIQLDQRMSAIEAYATQIDKIDDIDTSLNQLLATSAGYVTQSDLAGITNGMASEDQIASLQASIDALNITNADLLARLEALEGETSSGSSSSSPTDVRWEFRTPRWVGYAPGDGLTYSKTLPTLSVEHFRIDEEGSYEFALRIRNNDGTLPSNPDTAVNLELTLAADRGEALLDDTATYVYTDDMPSEWFDVSWIDWDDGDFTTVTKGGVDVTRRVDFETENISIPSIPAGESVELELVLELYYE